MGIPKLEVIDFGDFVLKSDEKEIKYFFSMVYKIIENNQLNIGGYKIITNSGINGGQEVPHFHVHILGGERLTQ